MSEEVRISPKERKELTTGAGKKAPKYTFYALNNSVKYSSANQKPVVGEMTKIYEEFEEQYPEGDFQDWKNFYYNQYNGRERLNEATEKTYDMFLTIRAAIDEIDREDVNDFIEGLVLNGIYSNQNAREAVVEKILNSRPEFEPLTSEDGPEECDLLLGDRYVAVQPETIRSENVYEREDIIVIYYSENDSDNGLRIDLSESNRSLREFE